MALSALVSVAFIIQKSFLLHLVVGLYPVLYPMCLFSRNVDVQLSYQRFDPVTFRFPFPAVFVIMLLTCSSPN